MLSGGDLDRETIIKLNKLTQRTRELAKALSQFDQQDLEIRNKHITILSSQFNIKSLLELAKQYETELTKYQPAKPEPTVTIKTKSATSSQLTEQQKIMINQLKEKGELLKNKLKQFAPETDTTDFESKLIALNTMTDNHENSITRLASSVKTLQRNYYKALHNILKRDANQKAAYDAWAEIYLATLQKIHTNAINSLTQGYDEFTTQYIETKNSLLDLFFNKQEPDFTPLSGLLTNLLVEDRITSLSQSLYAQLAELKKIDPANDDERTGNVIRAIEEAYQSRKTTRLDQTLAELAIEIRELPQRQQGQVDTFKTIANGLIMELAGLEGEKKESLEYQAELDKIASATPALYDALILLQSLIARLQQTIQSKTVLQIAELTNTAQTYIDKAVPHQPEGQQTYYREILEAQLKSLSGNFEALISFVSGLKENNTLLDAQITAKKLIETLAALEHPQQQEIFKTEALNNLATKSNITTLTEHIKKLEHEISVKHTKASRVRARTASITGESTQQQPAKKSKGWFGGLSALFSSSESAQSDATVATSPEAATSSAEQQGTTAITGPRRSSTGNGF